MKSSDFCLNIAINSLFGHFRREWWNEVHPSTNELISIRFWKNLYVQASGKKNQFRDFVEVESSRYARIHFLVVEMLCSCNDRLPRLNFISFKSNCIFVEPWKLLFTWNFFQFLDFSEVGSSRYSKNSFLGCQDAVYMYWSFSSTQFYFIQIEMHLLSGENYFLTIFS